jgi:hypothetical protein
VRVRVWVWVWVCGASEGRVGARSTTDLNKLVPIFNDVFFGFGPLPLTKRGELVRWGAQRDVVVRHSGLSLHGDGLPRVRSKVMRFLQPFRLQKEKMGAVLQLFSSLKFVVDKNNDRESVAAHDKRHREAGPVRSRDMAVRKSPSATPTTTTSRVRTLLARLNDPTDVRCAIFVSLLLCLGEVALCSLIVWRVPYTEIDWKAYMSEVGGYLEGERDYTKLRGRAAAHSRGG